MMLVLGSGTNSKTIFGIMTKLFTIMHHPSITSDVFYD